VNPSDRAGGTAIERAAISRPASARCDRTRSTRRVSYSNSSDRAILRIHARACRRMTTFAWPAWIGPIRLMIRPASVCDTRNSSSIERRSRNGSAIAVRLRSIVGNSRYQWGLRGIGQQLRIGVGALGGRFNVVRLRDVAANRGVRLRQQFGREMTPQARAFVKDAIQLSGLFGYGDSPTSPVAFEFVAFDVIELQPVFDNAAQAAHDFAPIRVTHFVEPIGHSDGIELGEFAGSQVLGRVAHPFVSVILFCSHKL